MQGDEQPQSPGWQFTPQETAQDLGQNEPLTDGVVSWSASEYVSHQKGASWYLKLALVGLLVSVIVFLMTRDFISTGVVIFAAAIMGILSAKQPRVLEYRLNGHGLSVGGKFYDYTMFKSFSVIDDGGPKSIILMPLKRFMPLLSVYFDPEDEEKVLDILSSHLAFDHREYDMVDKFMRKVRF